MRVAIFASYVCAGICVQKMYNGDAFCRIKTTSHISGACCTAEGGTQPVREAQKQPQRADCFHLKSIEKLLKL